MYLCLRVCVGHIHQNGLVPVFRVWGVPKTSSPNDDVHSEVSVCSQGFSALYLMRDPQPLESAGDFMEKRLVLVYLRAGSRTDACVSGVHISCIAAGAPHSHILLNPHEAPSLLYRIVVVRVSLGRRLPVAQRTNALTYGVVERT